MIIFRTNQFSETKKTQDNKPKSTRVGIGWLQSEMDKNESERVFKKINEQIDKDYKDGKSKKEIVRNAKRRGKREILKKDVPGLVGKTVGMGAIGAAGTYAISKIPGLSNEMIERNISYNSLKTPAKKIVGALKKNPGKSAAIVGAGFAGAELFKKRKGIKKISKKVKAAENAGERTANARIK